MNTFLKKASKADCDLLFKWANDKEVRENSFTKDEIKYDDHIKWLEDKLNCCTSDIFIFYLDNEPIGQVRIDIENNEAVISYSIDKDYRGNGLSTKMLAQLEVNIESNINKLIGYVKFNNVTSQKVFEKLAYTKTQGDDCIKYYKIF